MTAWDYSRRGSTYYKEAEYEKSMEDMQRRIIARDISIIYRRIIRRPWKHTVKQSR